jgi:hypothetical protein
MFIRILKLEETAYDSVFLWGAADNKRFLNNYFRNIGAGF